MTGEGGMLGEAGNGTGVPNEGGEPGTGNEGGAHAGGTAGKTPRGGRGGASARGGRGGKGGKGGAGAATGFGGAHTAGAGGVLAAGAGGVSTAGAGGISAGAGGITAGAGGSVNQTCLSASTVMWNYFPQVGEPNDSPYGTNLTISGIAEGDTVLVLSLFSPDNGAFALGSGDNANLATCEQCLQGKLYGFNGADRDFFADAGVLDIGSSSDVRNGVIHASTSGVRLGEVTIDGSTTTPVPGGYCIDLADGAVDVSSSSGTGGTSGAGGEGGTPGSGATGNEGGAAGAFTLPTDCTEIGVGTWGVSTGSDGAEYYSHLSPNVGSPAQDVIGLLELSNDVGSFKLGTGDDASFWSCAQCLLVNIPDGTTSGMNFFAMGGTLDISSSSQPFFGTMDATLSDVTLVQVDASYEPIDSGQCLHLPSASMSFQ
jgi:hypothetical protein